METQDQAGRDDVVTHVIRDVATAVGQRPNESRQQQLIRTQAATDMIENLGPLDVAEAMFAGHCMMFHAVLTDSVQGTLRGEIENTRRATRPNIVALNSAFHMNFGRLDQRQTRRAKAAGDTPKSAQSPGLGDAEAETVALQTEIAAADQGPAAASSNMPSAPQPRPRIQLQTEPVPESSDENTIVLQAPPGVIAVCQANPEVMEALEAGDVQRFARAVGVALPGEVGLAALNLPDRVPGKTTEIQPAPYRPNRHERRHPR